MLLAAHAQQLLTVAAIALVTCVREPLAAYLSKGKSFDVVEAAHVLEDGFKRYGNKLAHKHGVRIYSTDWAANRRVLKCTRGAAAQHPVHVLCMR
jgi:hypothetical protein